MAGHRDWDKDLLLDTLHWMRQILALAFGVAFGVVPLTGALPFFAFSGINLLSGFVLYRSFRVDEEDFGGHQVLIQEGMAQASSLFMVTWICVYSLYNQ